MLEDKEIVQLYWNRDEKAIEATQTKYGNYCNSIAFNIINNQEDAEECVNEAYLKTWNSIPPNKPNSLRTYVGKLVRNVTFDLYRKKTAIKRGSGQIDIVLNELGECVCEQSNPETELEKKQLENDINIFLDTLSKEKKAIFLRRYWYSESVSDIAKRYGMSENSVSVKLNRIRNKFKNYLLERGHVL